MKKLKNAGSGGELGSKTDSSNTGGLENILGLNSAGLIKPRTRGGPASPPKMIARRGNMAKPLIDKS